MIAGLKNSENSHVTQINNKKVILDIDTGKYYLLNNVGTLIWNFIQSDKDLTVEEVSRILAEKFDQNEEAISKEVKYFIENISKFGLISS